MKKRNLIILGVAVGLLLSNLHHSPKQNVAGVTPSPTPSYFAQVDVNGNVVRVLEITQEVVNTGTFGDPTTWIQTFTGSTVFAGKGYKYDNTLKTFIAP